MFVTKIGRTELGRPQFVRFQHPQQRPPHERIGVHNRVIHAGTHYAEVVTNQAHVVRQRHPAQALVILGPACSFYDGANIYTQVAVCQADPFGIAGRA